jgi:hypothetical protein
MSNRILRACGACLFCELVLASLCAGAWSTRLFHEFVSQTYIAPQLNIWFKQACSLCFGAFNSHLCPYTLLLYSYTLLKIHYSLFSPFYSLRRHPYTLQRHPCTLRQTLTLCNALCKHLLHFAASTKKHVKTNRKSTTSTKHRKTHEQNGGREGKEGACRLAST